MNRLIRKILLFSFYGFLSGNALAQPLADQSPETLTEKLIQEDPVKLVLQAKESGNIVRGAILFHQGEVNCAKCHRPSGETAKLAPDLSRLGKDVTDVSLVESILQPSKVLRKGFETLAVITTEGRVLNGTLVREDENQIVLRSLANVDELITVDQDDVEEKLPGKVSAMPSGLVNQLKGRQQFLDLLRYVMETRERGPTASVSSADSVTDRELSPELKGLVLIRELNCVACHQSSMISSLPAAKQGPDFNWSARWLNPASLAKFIANPHETKPGTSMPTLMGHLPPTERIDVAEQIVHYLVSVIGNEFVQSSTESDSMAVERGKDVFHSVGCVACHSPRDERALEQPLEDSVAMGKLDDKYSHDALVSFLKDPGSIRRSGRMPNMQLTHRETLDLSSYLLQSSIAVDASTQKKWGEDLQVVANGKRLFEKFSCGKCHAMTQDAPVSNSRNTFVEESVVGVEPFGGSVSSQLALGNVDAAKGCLSRDNGGWPAFHLTDADRMNIQAAIKRLPQKLEQGQLIDFSLASFRCTACHSRDGLGGVDAKRRAHFQTTNLNLGEQGRIPPTLSGVGAKLNEKWMREVLVQHRAIRPYMKTRMPQYGEANVGHLVDLFQTADSLSETEFAKVTDSKETRKLGLKIAGKDGLNCVACHTFQYKLSDTMPAVDLTEMAERLKKEWFYQYMLAPQRFSPNTVMPSFWPNGHAIRADIPGTPKDHIEALWEYLLDGRQARMPSGVVREPLEIVVTDEARMLRRKYPEIGKRGIGVGYPGGVNLAYDAEQMRLATLWKGKFVDPAGVWYGQGHGNVRVMGQAIQLPKGPELDDESLPWKVDGTRPPQHQFKGYELDSDRRPRLKYVFGSISVEDYFTEMLDAKTGQFQLRRRVTMTSPLEREQLRFRLAVADTIVADSVQTYRVGGRLRIRVASDQKAKVSDDGKQLFVPVRLEANVSNELVIEYLWE